MSDKYLRNRALVTELLQRHYTETTTNHSTTHLLHRKLKLSKYIRRQKANKDMAAKLKNIRCQQPVRGVRFRRLLKKHGLLVYLMDEFRTSQCCPSDGYCSLTIFKRIPNPWSN
ncbi:hypothetical protein RO3G_07588 [Rhizopus delemar RA 99-880]|uniref:Uncharacterized protein n=1 Tax=Rhizopus delemar (strain RA 99-880 / ATCC MYA-4621 / FGSC 9543 / NRRL 43880) TaxID=246409 RepID=I1C353_RHIO9|nr:hypothetical protein RO3G_07588 [Rhizopus delemar RA 99-880]|eukprot:EIE82883.1 hypothetical protein RO3G_07588 [Rhizopus delemar RA 99-880]